MSDSAAATALERLAVELEDLGCPHIDDGSAAWMAEMFLHPSELRFKVLNWMLEQFDPVFKDFLDGPFLSTNHHVDSRHQKQLFALHMIGVCRMEDVELVRGTSSQRKQITFWEKLTAMIKCLDTLESKKPSASDDLDGFSLHMPHEPLFVERYTNCLQFIDAVAQDENYTDLFNSEVSLFPPDLQKMMPKDASSRPTIPGIETLINTAQKLTFDMETCIQQLQELKQKGQYQDMEQSEVEHHCRKVDLSLRTFSQLIDSYTYVYENQIGVWCNKPKPNLTGLGSQLKGVHTMLSKHKALTDSLQTTNDSSTFLMRDFKAELTRQQERFESMNISSTDTMQRTIEILEESTRRKMTGT